MSSVQLFSSRSYGALMSRLVWPTATLLIMTFAIVFGTILWTSDGANQAAAERQSMQLTAALEQRLYELKGRLAQLVTSPGLSDLFRPDRPSEALQARFAQNATRFFDFDGAFLVGADGRVISGMMDGKPAGQAAFDGLRPMIGDLVETARLNQAAGLQHGPNSIDTLTAEGDLGSARLLNHGETTIAVATLSLEAQAATPSSLAPEIVVAIAYKRFRDLDLKRIADLHAMQGFRTADEPPGPEWWSLPLQDGHGETKAFLTWKPERPGDLMRERLLPLVMFGSLVAFALFLVVVGYIRWIAKGLARSQQQAQNLIGRDALSGLPNRLFFAERLDRELGRLERREFGLAVLFLDLDRFKDVNDTYGHQAGDDLIKLVAQRLLSLLRGADTLARFGGDEFAIIQTDMRSPQDAQALARRILDALSQSFVIAGTEVTIGVSIGVALAPLNGTDRESLMRLADMALYQAKSEGRNRYSLFARQMDDTIRMRKVVEDDLRQAIANDELALLYQPIFSADGATIVGLEALVRWPHPKQGLISPARFIPLAEERGLIIPLGEWVLRRACRDAQRWPGLRVAINVSAIQFRHRDFVASVTRTLQETGFEASRLELELTEGVVVENADAAEAAMMELRGLGVNLALDDFGTGYSSLIYLRRFAFDKIKIDRSFLESMEATGESAILVHSIVHLGRALGLTVTAEGVETDEQHRFLQALGCHQVQGYLFSKPVTADEIDQLLHPALDARTQGAAA